MLLTEQLRIAEVVMQIEPITVTPKETKENMTWRSFREQCLQDVRLDKVSQTSMRYFSILTSDLVGALPEDTTTTKWKLPVIFNINCTNGDAAQTTMLERYTIAQHQDAWSWLAAYINAVMIDDQTMQNTEHLKLTMTRWLLLPIINDTALTIGMPAETHIAQTILENGLLMSALNTHSPEQNFNRRSTSGRAASIIAKSIRQSPTP